jgi:hypothetical protein
LPLALLYGAGRPDLPAKIHVLQVCVHVPLTFFLVRSLGITGAAAAWSTRCALDLILYELASRAALGSCTVDTAERKRTTILWISALILGLSFAGAAWLRRSSLPLAIALLTTSVFCYTWSSWTRVFSRQERRAWLTMFLPAPARAALVNAPE